MIVFLSLLILASAFERSTLKTSLQSPRGRMQLFQSWMKAEHTNYSPKERKERSRLFMKNVEAIVAINEAQDKFECDTNFMSAMTEEERNQMMGINITAYPADIIDNSPPRSNMPAAGSKDWKAEGKVTPVQNQGKCGSCWAFSGVTALESHYAIQTGSLLEFSVQEFVDCYSYGAGQGCRGGWYFESYKQLKAKQHLALAEEYKYTARAGNCRADSTKHAMTAAKITSHVRAKGDEKLVQALEVGPVAVAVDTRLPEFYQYKTGILSIPKCGTSPTKALAVTGYTPEYFDCKNTWGSDWGGMEGYVRIDRKINNMCGISNYIAYPVLEKTEKEE